MKVRVVSFAVISIVVALGLFGCMGPTIATSYDAGWSCQEKGYYKDAIASYEKFIKDMPDSTLVPLAMHNIAYCYAGLGEKENAIAAYEKLIVQYSNSDYAKWAAEDLELLKAGKLTLPPAKEIKIETTTKTGREPAPTSIVTPQ